MPQLSSLTGEPREIALFFLVLKSKAFVSSVFSDFSVKFSHAKHAKKTYSETHFCRNSRSKLQKIDTFQIACPSWFFLACRSTYS